MAKGKGGKDDGKSKGKVGRKSGNTKEEDAYLESYGERFTTSSDHSTLYTEVVDGWIARFGYSGVSPSLGLSPADLELDVDTAGEQTEATGRIQVLRAKAKQSIRMVRVGRDLHLSVVLILPQKLSNWFRSRYAQRKEDRDGVQGILDTMVKISTDRPSRPTEFQMYNKLYYSTKVKAAFNEMWAGCRLAGVPQKEHINLCKKFTTQMLENEPDDLKADIKRICDEEYARDLRAWEARVEWQDTPKSYTA